MKLVLDTSILCQDLSLIGLSFRVLFDGMASVPATLSIPEVVMDEVENRFREDLRQVADEQRRNRSKLSLLLGRDVEGALEAVNIEAEALAYRQRLLDRIRKSSGEVLPYPDVPHKLIVQRDLRRLKPFKRNGAGYRDFLIWESIRRLMRSGHERIALITGNVKDFGRGPLVDQDLQQDVLNPDRLRLFPSLQAFNDEVIVPRLKMLDDVRAALQQHSADSLDVGAWLIQNLVDILRGEELGPVIAAIPDGAGRFFATKVEELQRIAVDEVRQLASGAHLVRLTVQADVEVSIDIDWEDYVRYDAVRDYAGPATEAFVSSSWYEVPTLTVAMDLVAEPKSKRIELFEVHSVVGPNG